MSGPAATWRLMTPAAAGAVAIVQVWGEAGGLEAVGRGLGIGVPPVGGLGLREIAGLDTVLAARVGEGCLELMPHGGPAAVRGLIERLGAAGAVEDAARDARRAYPEAADRLEAEMLDALARAASPGAVEALLAQPALWRAAQSGLGADGLPGGEATERDRRLGRLIRPPLVAAVGAANIGKSTLCNALAGREVSLVADEPGTTRDHVGVLVELDGLVVRYVDTPGVREAGGVEAEAAGLARAVVRSADLVLACGDPGTPPPPTPAGVASVGVCLRGDLGAPGWAAEVVVSVRAGRGLEGLAAAVRERLAPRSLGAERAPWRFWAGAVGG